MIIRRLQLIIEMLLASQLHVGTGGTVPSWKQLIACKRFYKKKYGYGIREIHFKETKKYKVAPCWHRGGGRQAGNN